MGAGFRINYATTKESAKGGDCLPGAMAAAISELAGEAIGASGDEAKQQQITDIMGAMIGFVFSGGKGGNVGIASNIATSAHVHNYLSHEESAERARLLRKLEECKLSNKCSAEEVAGLKEAIQHYDTLDTTRDTALRNACDSNPAGPSCKAKITEALGTLGIQVPNPAGDIQNVGQMDLLEYIRLYETYANHPDPEQQVLATEAGAVIAEYYSTLRLLNDYSQSQSDVLSDIVSQTLLEAALTIADVIAVMPKSAGKGSKPGNNPPNDIDNPGAGGNGDLPKFITDSGGNTIDLNATSSLRSISQSDVNFKAGRGGSTYDMTSTPNSYANLGNGHAVVYGADGRALYDVSSSRVKIFEWNQNPNTGQWFPRTGSDLKAFEGNVPQSLINDLGLN